MSAEKVIQEIFTNKTVIDADGNKYVLEANIDKEEGKFLQTMVSKYNISKSIEIGCAYGLSSLYICSSLKGNDVSHTIIDPFQNTDWNGIGINNLNQAGITFYKLIEKPSEIALPELLTKNEKYQLGFIDGWHTFDQTLLDFYYLDRMIGVGGIIIIDDAYMKGINAVLRYIINNFPNYEYIGHVKNTYSRNTKILNTIQFIPMIISKLLPTKELKHHFFSSEIIQSNKSLHLNCSMIAFRKTAKDTRPWNWFKPF